MTNFDIPVDNESRQRLSGVRYALIAVILLLVFVFGDWLARNLEMNALVTRIEESETEIVISRDLLGEVNEKYDRTLRLSPGSEAIRQEWLDEIEVTSEVGAEAVIAAGAPIKETVIMPWHRAIQRARRQYLEHHEAWEEELVTVAKDGTKIGDANPLISATFTVAERSLSKAVPPFSLFGLEQRVALIFED